MSPPDPSSAGGVKLCPSEHQVTALPSALGGEGETDTINVHTQINAAVLGLARTERTFLTAAPGVVRLGCVAKIVDNAPVFHLLLSSACTVSQLSLFLTTPPMCNWERTQPAGTGQRDIPYQVTSHLAINLG